MFDILSSRQNLFFNSLTGFTMI